ncbi:unnamed protein product [Bursaphelenchus xylophilus]|uniref:(pine wood nematode) hypothetical protein n=1 Tax=Bursaphelenchus xylophilus TaxID=6326 RepID=A0A1I7RX72_BURXY|nr:unnamed protein product [Bursaphelenchus xylophilus]CAG9121382.1 unnamed protein product [Bursaphelenchus xylophilus]
MMEGSGPGANIASGRTQQHRGGEGNLITVWADKLIGAGKASARGKVFLGSTVKSHSVDVLSPQCGTTNSYASVQLDKSGNNRLKAEIPNYPMVLKRDPKLGQTLKWNFWDQLVLDNPKGTRPDASVTQPGCHVESGEDEAVITAGSLECWSMAISAMEEQLRSLSIQDAEKELELIQKEDGAEGDEPMADGSAKDELQVGELFRFDGVDPP